MGLHTAGMSSSADPWTDILTPPLRRVMLFTFLGNAPVGIDDTTSFYAWASLEKDGEVVAGDDAPDVGWLKP